MITRSFTALLSALAVSGCASGEPLSVPSTTPYDFAQMGKAPAEVIDARLVLPEGEIRAAAILSHGSGGVGGRQTRMAERLAESGIASLVLDHFETRDISSTVRDQLRLSEQTMVADIFAAQALLSDRLGLPPAKIGVMGWSKGATATVLAAVDRFAGLAAGERRLGFAVAFYPFCGFALDQERVATPLLFLLGDGDDWTPAPPCERQAEAWATNGQPVSWEVYRGARHGFDSGAGLFEIGWAITVRDTSPGCTLAVDDGGRTQTLDGKHSLDTPETREAFLADCGERGVTFQGDDTARDRAYARVTAHLEESLSAASAE